MAATLRFLGAAGTVTGSRHLVTAGAARVLLDAGLFQGAKELRLRNRAPFAAPPASVAAVVLTHAHIDHSGALPLLWRQGFRGKVHCTPATRDLAGLLLPDSGRLQEEEARWANRRGYSKHAPNAAPLYTEAEAVEVLRQLTPLPYGERREVAPGVAVTLHRAGHILGSATALVEVASGPAPRRVLFSGDLGRYDAPILADPEPAPWADDLVLECTYGDKRHEGAPREELKRAVLETAARGGALLMPAFAIGRTQEVLFARLLRARRAGGARGDRSAPANPRLGGHRPAPRRRGGPRVRGCTRGGPTSALRDRGERRRRCDVRVGPHDGEPRLEGQRQQGQRGGEDQERADERGGPARRGGHVFPP